MDFPITEYFKLAAEVPPPRPSSMLAPTVATLGATGVLGALALGHDVPLTEDAAIQRHFEELDRMPTFKPAPNQIY